jgi:polygalacturonase
MKKEKRIMKRKSSNVKLFFVLLSLLLVISIGVYWGKRGSAPSVKNAVTSNSLKENEKDRVTPAAKNTVNIDKTIGNDQNDDTANIQRAIDSISERGGGVVFFPQGTYYIDALESINLKDNVTLDFSNGVTLKALPNDSGNYAMINIENVKNVTLNGSVHIEGERKEHKGSSGEWGMGISIKGSQNISINDVNVSDCWGDGIYIGNADSGQTNQNISISNPVLENNRRQGISVITAIDLKILNPKITNTNGTPPASGIDIEPNANSERLQNISIVNPSTANNEGNGIQIYLGRLKGTKYPVDITVNDTSKMKDGYKVLDTGNVRGTIEIGNKTVYKNK